MESLGGWRFDDRAVSQLKFIASNGIVELIGRSPEAARRMLSTWKMASPRCLNVCSIKSTTNARGCSGASVEEKGSLKEATSINLHEGFSVLDVRDDATRRDARKMHCRKKSLRSNGRGLLLSCLEKTLCFSFTLTLRKIHFLLSFVNFQISRKISKFLISQFLKIFISKSLNFLFGIPKSWDTKLKYTVRRRLSGRNSDTDKLHPSSLEEDEFP